MSPSPAAPSSASISACAITSPSECPASPRVPRNETPPSTSGTPGSSAWASNPVPTRRSANHGLRHLVEAVDGYRFRRRLAHTAPGPATDVHRGHPGPERREHVVVDAVPDVCDRPSIAWHSLGHALEELRSGLLDAPGGRRSDQIERKQAPQEILRAARLVGRYADDVPGLAKTREAVHRVRVEIRRLPLVVHLRSLDA